MKLALCTTTVNTPHVLKLYRACSQWVEFFVVGDLKTPEATWDLCGEINASAVSHPAQSEWKCSELIGWNCIQRRNIGFLEALKWGCDAVVSVDDDNAPLNTSFFDDIELALGNDFNGLKVGTDGGWFNVGQWQFPLEGGPVVQRGFPQEIPGSSDVGHVAGARVGVAQGICLGNPDTSAVDRISRHPVVHQVSELLHAGFVTDNRCFAPFNSQSIAILREFVPAFFLWPHVQRYDDIFASLVTQRVMREYGYHVHWGKPHVWQSRNEHDLNKDLRGEIDGMENVRHLAEILNQIQLTGRTVLRDCRKIWDTLSHVEWVPSLTVTAAQAYLDDVEGVI